MLYACDKIAMNFDEPPDSTVRGQSRKEWLASGIFTVRSLRTSISAGLAE